MLSVLMEKAGIHHVSPEQNLLFVARLICYFLEGTVKPGKNLSCQSLQTCYKFLFPHHDASSSQRDTAKLLVEQWGKTNFGERREGSLSFRIVKGILWFKLWYPRWIGNSARMKKSLFPTQEKKIKSWETSKLAKGFQMFIVLKTFDPFFMKEIKNVPSF